MIVLAESIQDDAMEALQVVHSEGNPVKRNVESHTYHEKIRSIVTSYLERTPLEFEDLPVRVANVSHAVKRMSKRQSVADNTSGFHARSARPRLR